MALEDTFSRIEFLENQVKEIQDEINDFEEGRKQSPDIYENGYSEICFNLRKELKLYQDELDDLLDTLVLSSVSNWDILEIP